MICAFSVSGCSYLPNSGPTASQIDDAVKDNNQLSLEILPVTPSVIKVLSQQQAQPSLASAWGNSEPRSVAKVGVGDILSIEIFVAGGSFGAATSGGDTQQGQSGIQSQSLPPVQVDEQGNVTLPYAGRLHVAGRPPAEIQHMIEDGLSGTVFRPQALVSVARNLTNTIMISGDVRKPGRYPLEFAGERVRDLVTIAGGPAFPDEDMQLRVSRNGSSFQVPFDQVNKNDTENIAIFPRDDIQLLYRPRTFLSFGASGRVSQVKFESDKLSLAEGIARVGGPSDDRADPSAVYLFRFEDPKTVAMLGKPPARLPIIYKINMLDPQSYFELQHFPMRDKDLIYVANASSNSLFRFLTLVNSVFIPVGTTYSITHS